MTTSTSSLLRQAASEKLLQVPEDIPGLDREVREVLGIRLVAVRSGTAIAELLVEESHLNAQGGLQGGIFACLADATAGWASDMTEGFERYATVDLKGSLTGSAALGDLITARGHTFHAGRRTCVNTVELTRDRPGQSRERPIAHFTCTQIVLD